jgi:hypothetical protein
MPALSGPTCDAVSALMTSSNLVACTTRQVGRFLALEDAAGIDADLTKRIRNIGSEARQSANFRNLTVAECFGDGVACC